ncbi:aryl-alcohol oxidase precursor [Punctularia strigosozonata HHB-11173 SS5]|uniref:aryl-alcohol oxidase precursor n=1 Tax=Punctularia strigosozonata (strain HHB-11173) TaxID=741275 RepID=UPI000441637D|nr:aryl-alcohol oxidase precursor [Punctularia strigosozonata HHB-11173 SS5]EIN14580.1 aryl-alcohol oxidase precursor [Punctularia strigosozonata HHB-11173 SS5]
MQFLPGISLLGLVISAFAKIYEDVSALPTREFDFVLTYVGFTDTTRLTENSAVSVLVLEAGASNQNILDSEVPFLASNLWGSLYDWNYTTVPQVGLDNRTIGYPRGKLLGGSSSINLMAYTRGSSDDWDKYAEMSGDIGWSWKNIQPYVRKNEGLMPPGRSPFDPRYDPLVHSRIGPVEVSLPEYYWPSDHRVLEAAQELRREFPYGLDVNDGDPLGVGWIQSTIGNGTRSSAATAYLGRDFAARPNLFVLLHAHATRITTQNGRQAQSNAEMVAAADRSLPIGTRYNVTARKEIILAAGTFNTAQLLLLSGIGDSDALSSLGITPILHLPDVGRRMSDHPLVPVTWIVKDNITFGTFLGNSTNFNIALTQWNKSRTGPFSFTPPQLFAWQRVPDKDTFLQSIADPAAGPHSAHYELIFATRELSRRPRVCTFSFAHARYLINLFPTVTGGSITINSTDPFDPPLINPNLLGTVTDGQIMIYALRAARRFVETASAWKGYIVAESGAFTNATTDAELLAFARQNARTIWHAVGSCQMTPYGVATGCVDPDLKVKGAKGLRIIDGSVLPFVPSAHTQVPIYIIAERGSDLIKKDWGL